MRTSADADSDAYVETRASFASPSSTRKTIRLVGNATTTAALSSRPSHHVIARFFHEFDPGEGVPRPPCASRVAAEFDGSDWRVPKAIDPFRQSQQGCTVGDRVTLRFESDDPSYASAATDFLRIGRAEACRVSPWSRGTLCTKSCDGLTQKTRTVIEGDCEGVSLVLTLPCGACDGLVFVDLLLVGASVADHGATTATVRTALDPIRVEFVRSVENGVVIAVAKDRADPSWKFAAEIDDVLSSSRGLPWLFPDAYISVLRFGTQAGFAWRCAPSVSSASSTDCLTDVRALDCAKKSRELSAAACFENGSSVPHVYCASIETPLERCASLSVGANATQKAIVGTLATASLLVAALVAFLLFEHTETSNGVAVNAPTMKKKPGKLGDSLPSAKSYPTTSASSDDSLGESSLFARPLPREPTEDELLAWAALFLHPDPTPEELDNVGTRVVVYYDFDERFYPGAVVRRARDDSTSFEIAFDDGDVDDDVDVEAIRITHSELPTLLTSARSPRGENDEDRPPVLTPGAAVRVRQTDDVWLTARVWSIDDQSSFEVVYPDDRRETDVTADRVRPTNERLVRATLVRRRSASNFGLKLGLTVEGRVIVTEYASNNDLIEGDVVVGVSGVSVEGLTFDDVVRHVRNSASSTSMTIDVARPSS